MSEVWNKRVFGLFVALSLLSGVAPSAAQDLSPFRVGLLFYKQELPLDAAERWLVQAERLREAGGEDLRSAGYGYVLTTMAYEAADDDRAYGTWAEAVRILLQTETRWDLERERLAARLADVSSLLTGVDAAEPPSISDEILLLTEMQDTLQLTEYQGPRIGLSSPRTEISALEADEPRDVFAKPLALSDSESRSRYRGAPSDDAPVAAGEPESSGAEVPEYTRVDPRLSGSGGAASVPRRGGVEPLPTRVAAPVAEEPRPDPRADPAALVLEAERFVDDSRTAGSVEEGPAQENPDQEDLAEEELGPSPLATRAPIFEKETSTTEVDSEEDDGLRLGRSRLSLQSEGPATGPEPEDVARERPSAVQQAVARAAARVTSGDEAPDFRSRVAPVEQSAPTVGASEELIVFGPQIELSVLDEEEMESARIAWRYVQENLQVTSGFANAVNKYATLSIWEMGSLIAAIVSAHELGIVPKLRFDSMLDRVLQSLGRIPIYRDELPNLEYNSATGEMIDTRHRGTDRGSGFSSLDTGRLLVWLRIVKEWYPAKAEAVDGIVARFDFERATEGGELRSVRLERAQEIVEQQGRLGYEQYAATGFALWRSEVESAMDLDEVGYREIFGVSVPFDRRASSFLTSEPFVLAGLELGGISADFSRLAKAVFDVQQRRWEEDDVLTALSEDSLSQPPWFIYGSILHGEATWNAFDSSGQIHEQYRGLSTKAAFGWHALYANAFTQRLVDVASQLEHPRYGFFAGLFESGEVNEALSLNTNAVVLESILYRQRGNRPFLQIEFQQGATRGYRRR